MISVDFDTDMLKYCNFSTSSSELEVEKLHYFIKSTKNVPRVSSSTVIIYASITVDVNQSVNQLFDDMIKNHMLYQYY